MPNRLHTHKQNKRNTDVSSTPVQGMFQSRAFEVPSPKADSSQQPSDLKTSLMRAERYGHSLLRMHFADHQSAPTAVQPKMVMGDNLPHVVQQRKGLVSVPQGKGTPINTDPKLEEEADILGSKAAQGEQVQVAGVGSGLQGKDTAIQLARIKSNKRIANSTKANSTKAKSRRAKSRREIALGKTPGKTSVTGRKVLERWHKKPSAKARWIGTGTPDYKKQKDSSGKPLWEVHVKDKGATTRTWMPLDENIHMGHKLGAVDYWEKGAKGHITKKPRKYEARYGRFKKPGYQAAPKFKDKIHREFMMNSNNYRFEYGPANSSDGAKMKTNYTNLPKGEKKW